MHLNRRWTAAALALSLGGCASLESRDENLSYVRVPVGSTVEVTREVVVPPGQTRVFLRSDHPSPGAGGDGVVCDLEVRTLSDGSRPIHPGVFRVTRVQTQPFVEVASREPTRVAAFELAGGDLAASDGPLIAPTVHMYLFSPQQPDVMRLSCRGHFDVPAWAKTPSIAQIRRALGDSVRLELAWEEAGR